MAPRSVDGFDGATFNNSDPHQGMDGHPEGPLLHAAFNNHFESLQNILQQQHPDLNRRDCFGWTALGLAAERGHEAVVMALLQANADVSLHADDGKTALMIACYRGVVNIVIPLLERGAQVDDVDEYGRTAMWWACRYGHAPIVELLLFRYNANHTIADSAGRLAVDVALKHGHDRCAWLVLAKGRQYALHKARCISNDSLMLKHFPASKPPLYLSPTRLEAGTATFPSLEIVRPSPQSEHWAKGAAAERGAPSTGKRVAAEEKGEEDDRNAVIRFAVLELGKELFDELQDCLYMH